LIDKGSAPFKKLLFHGTYKTEPETIYKSRKGFEMKCQNGKWG
jgi:hypothetical protein